MLAHLPLSERLALAETFGELVAQRRAAEEHAGRVQIQADEWERAARGSAEEATAWRSKAQAWTELAGQVADDLDGLAATEGQPGTGVSYAQIRALASRLRGPRAQAADGDSLPSDGEMVRTEETVKVGDKL